MQDLLQRRGAPEAAAEPAGGSALPAAVQAKMERALGADFADVRVHEGDRAGAMGALAYAQGNHLHFAPGRYDPHSQAGQELLGHELTHVVQQRAGRVQLPQGKLLPINVDASLEAEADALGARAARGEVCARPGSVSPARAPAQAPIQRFADPVTNAQVDIATLDRDAVEKYIDLVQKKKLKTTLQEFKQLCERRKEYDVARKKIGESNAEGMNIANTQGANYLHNVQQEKLTELTTEEYDPRLGHADPAYFARESKFTWRLKTRVSAADAIETFLAPADITIAECQTILQAVFYRTVLKAVGKARFDAVLGRADADIAADDRLLLQMDFNGKNPLGRVLESLVEGAPVSTRPDAPHARDGGPSDHLGLDREERSHLAKDGSGKPVSSPDHRPAKLGGWYYLKNHEFYTERHKGGVWAGENALYVGRNEEGSQVFSGFGMANCTEQQMATTMAQATNAAPSTERAEALFQQGKYGLALPVLGSIPSVDQMTLSPAMIGIIDGLWAQGHGADPPSGDAGVARTRFKALLATMELPQPVTADQILTQMSLSEAARGMGAAQNQLSALTSKGLTLTWAEDQATGIACVAMTAVTTKPLGVTVSVSDFVKLYAQQYGLEYHAVEMQAAFRMLNDHNGNLRLEKGKPLTLYFPRPSVYIKRVASPSGFQMLASKNLSPDKLKQVFGVDELFAT